VSESTDKSRILVVDDNPAIHQDFGKILTPKQAAHAEELDKLEADLFGAVPHPGLRPEFEVEFALQGEEGVEKLQRALADGRPFKVAFLDVRMPAGMSGVETADCLWKVDPRLQVVFCTAYSDYSLGDLVARLGANDRWVVLKKPFDAIEVWQLAQALSAKWELLKANQLHTDDLERRVAERTALLSQANDRLRAEMAEREQMEHELWRVHKLEALGRLAAGIGHEINNPLAFAMAHVGFLDEALDSLGRESSTEILSQARTDLANIKLGIDRIRSIVREMKLFSRIDDDDQSSSELRLVLELATKMVAAEVRNRARLLVEVQEVPQVRGNQGRLEQVFVNLLLNAAQAIPPGHVADNEVRISVRKEDDVWVRIEVSDTGEGMSPEAVDQLFEPFFTTKPIGVGTGLGLSICQGIIGSLGGQIRVSSNQGRGTTVGVLLPIAGPAPARRATSKEQAALTASGRRARVLLVEDEPLIASALARQLKPHEVQTCGSGREALEQCLGREFDIIFCDLMMDDMTGMDLYEHLQSERPTLARRMVFITGGAYTAQAREFLQKTEITCLEKPIEGKTLRALVEKAICDTAPS
jgi:two-component system, NtrC family, sensor kinase